jgi:YfiH family protein
MFSFRNDPDADGVGIAFFDAVAADGRRLDLTLGCVDGWRGADWQLAEAELGVPVLNAYQVHSARVIVVDAATDPRAVAVEQADALVTTARGLAVAVRVADCLPVLFADQTKAVIGAAHAGRVGLAAGVLTETVATMRALGASRLQAWIGPHICGACYEVPEELRAEISRQLPAAWAQTSWGTPSLDLGAAAKVQLEAVGCEVVMVDPCTRTTSSLHSYRRDGAQSGRQAGAIWLPARS